MRFSSFLSSVLLLFTYIIFDFIGFSQPSMKQTCGWNSNFPLFYYFMIIVYWITCIFLNILVLSIFTNDAFLFFCYYFLISELDTPFLRKMAKECKLIENFYVLTFPAYVSIQDFQNIIWDINSNLYYKRSWMISLGNFVWNSEVQKRDKFRIKWWVFDLNKIMELGQENPILFEKFFEKQKFI